MEIHYYRATLKSDSGKHVLIVPATSEQVAIHLIQEAENCPRCAIVAITQMEPNYKLVEYAYPTSTTATKAGFGKTGCWFVALYEKESYKRKKILFYSLDKLAATFYAETLLYPYHWMHHYLIDAEKRRAQQDSNQQQLLPSGSNESHSL